MPLDHKGIVTQIDDVLSKCNPNASGSAEISKSINLLLSAIRRLAPPGSSYADNLAQYDSFLTSSMSMALILDLLCGDAPGTQDGLRVRLSPVCC